jgi:hypothetical protein
LNVAEYSRPERRLAYRQTCIALIPTQSAMQAIQRIFSEDGLRKLLTHLQEHEDEMQLYEAPATILVDGKRMRMGLQLRLKVGRLVLPLIPAWAGWPKNFYRFPTVLSSTKDDVYRAFGHDFQGQWALFTPDTTTAAISKGETELKEQVDHYWVPRPRTCLNCNHENQVTDNNCKNCGTPASILLDLNVNIIKEMRPDKYAELSTLTRNICTRTTFHIKDLPNGRRIVHLTYKLNRIHPQEEIGLENLLSETGTGELQRDPYLLRQARQLLSIKQ